MNCRDATAFLMDFLAGELPPETRRDFESHLSRCPDCGTFLAQYQQTVKAGKKACAEEDADAATDFPEDLLKAIMEAVRAQKP
jgi:anti-sigma factor RsiW